MPDIYVSQPPGKKKTEKKGEEVTREKRPHGRPTHRLGPFSAYARHPVNIRFENQEKDEEVVLFLRQHPIVNIPWVLIAILMFFAPLLLIPLPILQFFPVRFQVISILVWYLLTTAFILENFLGWLFNIYIITTHRIVDIDFFNLIQKQVSDAERYRIQDVTYRLGGVVGTLFNFGDVLIQTAGTAPNFDFLKVPKPDRVVSNLQEFQREDERMRRRRV